MSLTLFFEAVLAALVLAVGLWAITARSAFMGAVGFVCYGLLLALVWVQLAAIDVALTEVAVGSGLTGVLLLTLATRLRGAEDAREVWPGRGLRMLAGAGCAAVSAALAFVVLNLPATAPTLAPEAVEALPAIGVENPVTGVLMAFRAFDTLLEKVVLVVALIGAWSLSPDRYWGGRPTVRLRWSADGVLPSFVRVLAPLGVLLGIHLMWIGADAPGGAFQGGTVLAAMWLIVMMAGLRDTPAIGARRLRLGIVAGPMLFLAVGCMGLLLADAFLAYPVDFAKPLIILIEIPMLLTIGLALGLLVAGPPDRSATSP